MKTLTTKKSLGMLLSILMTAAIFMSCSKENDVDTSMKLPDSDGFSKSLNEAEKEGLTYMVEQQKLLQNIYESMQAIHQEAIFDDMGKSKKQQVMLLSAKIDKYGITNPLNGLAAGEFMNPLIQQAYNEFQILDEMTLGESIIYSKIMEEAVIEDLEVLITEVEGNDDLVNTYRQIIEKSQADLDALFLETKGLIDLAIWYDPIKIFEPITKNLRDISKSYNPIKDF